MEFEKDKPTVFARLKPFLILIGLIFSIFATLYGSVYFKTPIGDKVIAIPQLSFIKNLPMPEINFEFDLLVFLNEGLENMKASIARKVTGKEPLISNSDKSKSKKTKAKPKKRKEEYKPDPEKMVTLRLKNGSSITGELIGQSSRAYVLYWQGGQVAFNVSEVESVERNNKGIV